MEKFLNVLGHVVLVVIGLLTAEGIWHLIFC